MYFSLTTLAIWLLIAFVVAFIGEAIAGRRAPDGILGATIIGFIGILLVVGLFNIHITNDVFFAEIPLLTSALVAAVCVFIWSGLAYRRIRGIGSNRGAINKRPRRRRW